MTDNEDNMMAMTERRRRTTSIMKKNIGRVIAPGMQSRQ
jgi:hypothetical protein